MCFNFSQYSAIEIVAFQVVYTGGCDRRFFVFNKSKNGFFFVSKEKEKRKRKQVKKRGENMVILVFVEKRDENTKK